MKASLFDPHEVTSAFRLLILPGGVTEVRVLHGVLNGDRREGTLTGYFDSAENVVNALKKVDRATGIYLIPNPVNPDLLARAVNRLKVAAKSESTGDQHITARRWLLIDCDAVRASGISANDAEHEVALALAGDIRAQMRVKGWPEPIHADSGNGAHLMYRIDEPTEDGGLISRCLLALDATFSHKTVKVDTGVFNPARIWKLPGTMACKGDSIPTRPHRMAKIIEAPDVLGVVTHDQLVELAALAPTQSTLKPTLLAPASGNAFDIESWIARYLPECNGPKPWKDGGRIWTLPVCPFNPDHTGDCAFVGHIASGAITAGCHHNSCQHWGWKELRDKCEPAAGRRSSRSVSSVSPSQAVSPDSWPDPQPLPDALPPVMAFNPDLLPASLRIWIKDIAERIQCPIDFPAVAAMVALSSLVGRKVGIRPKRKDDWLVVPNLWGGVIGRPGVMKTPAIQEPLKPLKRLEIKAKEGFDANAKEAEAARRVGEQRKKQSQQEIRKALKNPEEALRLARESLDGDDGEPVRKRYLVNDSTVEKLGEILNQNRFGVLGYRDEIIGLLKALDKEGQEGARSFYLEAWNGNGRYTFDRIARGTIDIEAAILSIIGGIQPGPLGEYLRAAAKGGLGDDGLIQRFQLLVWPDISKEWINIDRWPDSDARKTAHAVFEGLDNLDPDILGADTDPDDPDSIPFLRFEAAAQPVFDQWRAALEHVVRSGDLTPALESHLAKYRSLIPSLALIIHLADGGRGPVGVEALQRAIGWGVYLESQARRIYSQATNPAVAAALTLAKQIVAGKLKDGFDLRTVYRKGWSGLSSPEEAAAAAEILVDLDWLRIEMTYGEGRPGKVCFINPKIRVHDKERTGNVRPEIPPSPPGSADRTDRTDRSPPSGGSVSTDQVVQPDFDTQQPPSDSPDDGSNEGEATWTG